MNMTRAQMLDAFNITNDDQLKGFAIGWNISHSDEPIVFLPAKHARDINIEIRTLPAMFAQRIAELEDNGVIYTSGLHSKANTHEQAIDAMRLRTRQAWFNTTHKPDLAWYKVAI